MSTLKQFLNEPVTVPASTVWLLADISEAKGKQELYTRQPPQRLKALREHAIIESAVSSNRIEGVEVKRSRVETIDLGIRYSGIILMTMWEMNAILSFN